MKGRKINTTAKLKAHADRKFLLEGNAKLLTDYFQNLFNKPGVKVGYFGDGYLSDIHATAQFNQKQQEQGNKAVWDCFAVIEEFNQIDKKYELGHDAQLLPWAPERWGQSYFLHKNKDQEIMRNYFVCELDKVARYALPFIKNIGEWMPK
jgi:hypothetical protein